MGLSKAYGCVNHDLITAKLYSDRAEKNSLRLKQNYLTHRKNRIKARPEVNG